MVATGPPALLIVDTAKDVRADLLVMGTHGRTGVAHILIGSVAEKVVRTAQCPVLTVRGAGRKRRAPKSTGRRQTPAQFASRAQEEYGSSTKMEGADGEEEGGSG